MLGGNEQPSKRVRDSEKLLEFVPPNRQNIAFSWDLNTLKYPIEKNSIPIDSPTFKYLGNTYYLRLTRLKSADSIGCFLRPAEEEPNFFGSFDFEFDLVFKSNDERVTGLVKTVSLYSNECNSTLKSGVGYGGDGFFPKDDISQTTLSQYKILFRIKLNESFSSFSKFPVDHSSVSYNRLVAQINNQNASNVSFDVNGYIFHALKHNLIKTNFFETLLRIMDADESDRNAPISLKEVKINPETFHQILLWLNTGEIPMIWKPPALFELYRAADYFLMKDLCDAIIKFVTATFCEYNFGQVYEFALKIENEDLENAVLKKWKDNREKFEATDQIKKLLKRNEDPEFFLNLSLKVHGIVSGDEAAQNKFLLLKSFNSNKHFLKTLSPKW